MNDPTYHRPGNYEPETLYDRMNKAAVSPYGDAGDALDFALDHIDDAFERTDFLERWREGDVSEWPEYANWLHTQYRERAEKPA